MIREVSFNGNRIRIFDDGNIWVFATDIAKVMGYLNTTELTSNLGSDRKRISPHNTIVVNRDGFYRMTAARRNGEELRQFAESNIFNLKPTTDIVIAEPKRTPETVVSYTSEQFGELRTIEINGAIWFAGVDVCRALQIQNTSQAMANLENDERCMFNIGRQGETNFINEWGLYSLILSSRKPEARAYRRWVTHKVLPSIHRIGSYSETGNTVDAILAFAAEFDALKSQYAQVVAERDALRATLDGIVAMANQTVQPTLEDPISYIHRNRGFLTSYITSCIGAYTYSSALAGISITSNWPNPSDQTSVYVVTNPTSITLPTRRCRRLLASQMQCGLAYPSKLKTKRWLSSRRYWRRKIRGVAFHDPLQKESSMEKIILQTRKPAVLKDTLKHLEFGTIRVYEYDGGTWYSAVDICKALGLQNPTVAIKNIVDEDKILLPISAQCGSMNALNEEGVYTLALRSYKKDGVPFIRWFANNATNKESLVAQNQYLLSELEIIQKYIDRVRTEVLFL